MVPGSNLTIEAIEDHFQENGIMVSNRWRIGEEEGG
jgi:hypothetical protein